MTLRISRRAFAAGAAVLPLTPRVTEGETPKTEYTPHVFDPHELKTMAALAEIFIPRTDTGGANDAHVAEHLDALVPWQNASIFWRGYGPTRISHVIMTNPSRLFW